MRWSRPAVVTVVAVVLATAPQTAIAQDRERGEQLAQRLCAVCHMAPGQGEKRGANDIPGFAAIARRPQQTHDGVVAWLRSTPPMMPNHHLTQSEMHDLAAFILSLADEASKE